jgi:hypothetical protein
VAGFDSADAKHVIDHLRIVEQRVLLRNAALGSPRQSEPALVEAAHVQTEIVHRLGHVVVPGRMFAEAMEYQGSAPPLDAGRQAPVTFQELDPVRRGREGSLAHDAQPLKTRRSTTTLQ